MEEKRIISAEELYQQGLEYLYGTKNVETNIRKALQYLTESAEKGNDEAQIQLGEFYFFGMGIEKSETKAIEYYKKASQQRNLKSNYDYAICTGMGLGLKKTLTRPWNIMQRQEVMEVMMLK